MKVHLVLTALPKQLQNKRDPLQCHHVLLIYWHPAIPAVQLFPRVLCWPVQLSPICQYRKIDRSQQNLFHRTGVKKFTQNLKFNCLKTKTFKKRGCSIRKQKTVLKELNWTLSSKTGSENQNGTNLCCLDPEFDSNAETSANWFNNQGLGIFFCELVILFEIL